MQKNLIKFGLGIVGLVTIGALVFYGVQWYQYRNSPEYAQKLEYQKLVEAYKNDTYGGDTPEETLQLFIDALKAGDTDLAAKYFVLDERENEKAKLDQAKSMGKFQEVVDRLQQFKLSKQDETSASFVILDAGGILKYQASFVKNENGKWKILDL